MKDKKGFLLYRDMLAKVDTLSDDMAGKLFKTVLKYTNGLEIDTSNELLNYAFVDIKTHLDRDALKYMETCKKNKDSANKRWNKKNASASDSIGMNAKDADIDTDIGIDKEINISFDTFWNKYNKKTDRKKSEAKWIKLSNKDRENIMQTLPRYIESTPDSKFRKNPSTYLNNESWKDEIIGVPERKQLNAKLKYATPKEILPHFDNEQAMNDSLQSNTYVSNGEKIFPLRSKDGTRNKEGDYIIGTDKQLHKITV